VYPTLSACGSNSLTVVFNPTLPSDLENKPVKKRKTFEEEEDTSYLQMPAFPVYADDYDF